MIFSRAVWGIGCWIISILILCRYCINIVSIHIAWPWRGEKTKGREGGREEGRKKGRKAVKEYVCMLLCELL